MKKPDVIVHLDDDDDDLDLLREAMGPSDYRLVSFKTGADVFSYLNDHHTAVCLIILDINLPFGSGIDVLKEIRERPPYHSIPVVMLTSGGDAPHIKALKTQAVDVITKPMAFDGLQRIADHLLSICCKQQQL